MVFSFFSANQIWSLRAKQSATKEGYRLAYSNPSFELWFLLHFSNQQTEVEDCQALIRLLKQPGRLPDYEKNRDFFDTLKPLQAVAVQRAKNRSEQIRNQGVEPISRQSNPLTTVYELVEYLNSKIWEVSLWPRLRRISINLYHLINMAKARRLEAHSNPWAFGIGGRILSDITLLL